MLIKSTAELLEYRTKFKDKKIGFVPTMGNLHQGHLNLVKESLDKNDITFVSIFVNPTQFGPNEDLDKYPRTLEEDISKINSISAKQDVVIFAPLAVSEIYPNDWDIEINVPILSKKLCGLSRPTHFSGVCTVVYRLFSLVQPTNAYFGQKDYQQCLIVKKMVNNLALAINIEMIPITRDTNGLALSSRNQYLSKDEKIEALELNKTLNQIKDYILKQGLTLSLNSIKELVKDKLSQPRWEYLEVLDAQNLEEVNNKTNSIAILGAYKINQTRLIDNLVFQC